MVKVSVKWSKSSYDVDVEPSEGLETFQAALFSLTNVPGDRQKLMCKGKLLRSDADIAALTADSKVVLMGTADAIAAGPTKQILFEEDLTDKDRVKLAPSTVTSAGIVNLGNTCLPEHDSRVLTDSGFLFLADIEARIDAGQRVLYACYETSTQSIAYKPGRLVFAAPPTHWVDFTHAGMRCLWDATSDDYGSRVSASAASANYLTLRTTPEHEMFVQLCTHACEDGHESYKPRMAGGAPIPPHKQPARELAPGYQCDCVAADRTCTHGYSHYRMCTGAAAGLQSLDNVISLTDRNPHSPVAALGLHSKDERDAFLELFGFWLGDGSMSYDTHAGLGSADAVYFVANNERDRSYLLGLLARVNLECGKHFTSTESDSRLEVRIIEPRWFCFFDDEFGVKYSNSRHYDRRLALLKQGTHSTSQRSSKASPASGTRALRVSTSASFSLSASNSVELVADHSGYGDMSLLEADPVDDVDVDEDSAKWLPDWSLFGLDAKQMRLVIEGLRRADGSAAAVDKTVQGDHKICTSSIGFRDQLIHACVHAGYSAYFTLKSSAGELRGYVAVPEDKSIYTEEEVEAALQVDLTRQFKPVCGNHDSWWVHYSEAISELLPAQDVRFDGSVCRVRQHTSAIDTQPADLYDQKRDGRVWCVDVQHDDHLIFVQRAHCNASGVVTKVGRTLIVANCYLNSTLQAFRAVPELKQALIKYGNTPHSERDPEAQVTTNLGKLMLELDHSSSPITPMLFTTVFRSNFAQFAERNSEGAWAQQDADECLQTLIQAMAHKLGPYSGSDPTFLQSPSSAPSAASSDSTASSSPPGVVDAIFGGQLSTIIKCAESPDEPVRRSTETFRKLRCHIDQKIAFLSEGLAADMLGEQEMRSTTLGRSAVWHKRAVITQLPNYLIVQFVRFDWKKDTQKKAKVLKKVEFPLRLDVSDLCGKALKRSLLAARRSLKDEDDKKRGLASLNRSKNMAAIKQTAKDREREGKEAREEKKDGAAGGAGGNVAVDVDEEDAASDALQATATSGYYDLLSVITHKGRYADSGHYIGWSRSEPTSDAWWKYDDDVVSEVKSDDIKALSGGGDWHMAYLLVYKLDKDFAGKQFVGVDDQQQQTAKKDDEMKVDSAPQTGDAAPSSTS